MPIHLIYPQNDFGWLGRGYEYEPYKLHTTELLVAASLLSFFSTTRQSNRNNAMGKRALHPNTEKRPTNLVGPKHFQY
jgi:hypothetical protein